MQVQVQVQVQVQEAGTGSNHCADSAGHDHTAADHYDGAGLSPASGEQRGGASLARNVERELGASEA